MVVVAAAAVANQEVAGNTLAGENTPAPLTDSHFPAVHVVVGHRLGKDLENPTVATRAHSHWAVSHVVAEESTPDMAPASPSVLATLACFH